VAVPATDPCQPARLRHAPAGSLANLELSIDAQRAAHAAIHALSHDLAGGRWLLTGGGGYELVQVVPRAWTHLIAEAAASRSTRVPPSPGVSTLRGEPAWPPRADDRSGAKFVPFESGYDAADQADQAIMATATRSSLCTG
jgi:acetoin utilization protein AcuC